MREPVRHAIAPLLRLAVVFGIAFGMLEAAGNLILFAYDPLGVAFGRGATVEILWVAPLFNVLLFCAVATGLWLVFRFWPRPVPSLFVAGVFAFLTLLGLLLLSGVLHRSAALVLAGGATLAMARWAKRRASWILRQCERALPVMATVSLLLALSVPAGSRIREWLTVKNLPAAQRDTNVLLVVVDTLRADRLSGFGYPRPTSPHLDRLAEEGLSFTKAIAPSSWTLPSHASLFTGLGADEQGAFGRPLPGEVETLAETLRAAGFVTGGFVGNTMYCHRGTGLAQGFVHYQDLFGNWQDAVVRTVYGRRLALRVAEWLGYRGEVGRKTAAEIRTNFLGWMDAQPDRPFFAFLNLMDLHANYWPPESYAARVTGDPDRIVRARRPLLQDSHLPGEGTAEQWQLEIDAYDASLAYVDEELGHLVAALRERGILDSTLLIVTSDHGEALFEREMFGHGKSLYRETIHVPLLLRLPKQIPANQRDHRVASLADVPATVLSALQMQPVLPGRNLLAVAGPDAVAYSELQHNPWGPAYWPNHAGHLRSLVTSRWHFILHEGGRAELFDWESDPGEWVDLAGSPAGVTAVAALRSLMAQGHGLSVETSQAAHGEE